MAAVGAAGGGADGLAWLQADPGYPGAAAVEREMAGAAGAAGSAGRWLKVVAAGALGEERAEIVARAL